MIQAKTINDDVLQSTLQTRKKFLQVHADAFSIREQYSFACSPCRGILENGWIFLKLHVAGMAQLLSIESFNACSKCPCRIRAKFVSLVTIIGSGCFHECKIALADNLKEIMMKGVDDFFRMIHHETHIGFCNCVARDDCFIKLALYLAGDLRNDRLSHFAESQRSQTQLICLKSEKIHLPE